MPASWGSRTRGQSPQCRRHASSIVSVSLPGAPRPLLQRPPRARQQSSAPVPRETGRLAHLVRALATSDYSGPAGYHARACWTLEAAVGDEGPTPSPMTKGAVTGGRGSATLRCARPLAPGTAPLPRSRLKGSKIDAIAQAAAEVVREARSRQSAWIGPARDHRPRRNHRRPSHATGWLALVEGRPAGCRNTQLPAAARRVHDQRNPPRRDGRWNRARRWRWRRP